MLHLTKGKTILLALLVTLSLTGFGSCQRRPETNPAAFCPSSAFINEEEYELADLTSNSDKEFHAWAGDMATKYPELKDAYSNLRECWDYYHGGKK